MLDAELQRELVKVLERLEEAAPGTRWRPTPPSPHRCLNAGAASSSEAAASAADEAALRADRGGEDRRVEDKGVADYRLELPRDGPANAGGEPSCAAKLHLARLRIPRRGLEGRRAAARRERAQLLQKDKTAPAGARRTGGGGGGGGMQIFVKTLTGKTVTVDTSPSDTVDDIKAKIRTRRSRPTSSASFLLASSSRTAARLTTTSRRSRPFTWRFAPRWARPDRRRRRDGERSSSP